jgi:hypothetical protein
MDVFVENFESNTSINDWNLFEELVTSCYRDGIGSIELNSSVAYEGVMHSQPASIIMHHYSCGAHESTGMLAGHTQCPSSAEKVAYGAEAAVDSAVDTQGPQEK